MDAEEKYLTNLKSSKTVSKIFLSNGTMLKGLICDFGEMSIIVDKCLVYKDSIISITPEK